MRARPILTLLLALAVVIAVPAQASAGAGMETSIMDDQLLLNAPPAELERDMALFKRLGVDRLRVSAFWNQVSPDPRARTRPAGFDVRDHTSPLYNFSELDRVIDSATRNGLRVMVSISMPAPVWATSEPGRDNPLWKPRASDFADFAEAVARRYADRVDHWGISNEPNQGVWLQPQSDRTGPVAPHLYRDMVLASYPRIKAADPTSTALVGELAARGRSGRGTTRQLRPLLFLRAMGCRDARWRPVRRGRCRNFRAVPIDALGHHPYNLLQRPGFIEPNQDDAAINDGRRLTRTLDRLVRLGALAPGRRGRPLDIFYTEYGYQTTPPDPFAGVSLSRQRLYLQQAAFIAQRTPRVRGLNQFRLTDGAIAGRGPRRFQEFQSGLMFRNRRPKPSYGVFAHPFVISGDRFWGQVRPGGAHTVRVQRRVSARAGWRLVAQVPTDRFGYFTFRLPGRRAGSYRYLYENGGRSGVVTVRR